MIIPLKLLHSFYNLQNTRADEDYSVLHTKCIRAKLHLDRQMQKYYVSHPHPVVRKDMNGIAVELSKWLKFKHGAPIALQLNDLEFLITTASLTDLIANQYLSIPRALIRYCKSFSFDKDSRKALVEHILGTIDHLSLITTQQLLEYMYAKYYTLYQSYHSGGMLDRKDSVIFEAIANKIEKLVV